MASLCGMGLRLSSNSYTSGAAVGMFSSATTDSDKLSKYFVSARREFPWAAIRTRLPALTSGAITCSQNGRTRSRVI